MASPSINERDAAPPPVWHLAQVNIAQMRAPMTDPIMAEFVAGLGPVNALADSSPGFVWRLVEDEHGHATDDRPFGDDRILINLSVWESREALQHFVYHTLHQQFLKKRREWFERMKEAWVVLWWVPAGHRPTVVEAKARLEHLRTHGESPHAFSFREPFPPPAEASPEAASAAHQSSI
ncbi:MAG: DUF3291 domain-containing protein [Verrucomicrobia bacterium]|nr:DUF3291 domain-containing protein [Verrucomicrobiota bacterium]